MMTMTEEEETMTGQRHLENGRELMTSEQQRESYRVVKDASEEIGPHGDTRSPGARMALVSLLSIDDMVDRKHSDMVDRDCARHDPSQHILMMRWSYERQLSRIGSAFMLGHFGRQSPQARVNNDHAVQDHAHAIHIVTTAGNLQRDLRRAKARSWVDR